MGNLVHTNDEKLETLPRNQKMREGMERREHNRDIPWKRIDRFLHSQVGKTWDKVVVEFINKKWISPRFRTFGNLRDFVETHTFLDHNKEVCFNDDRSGSCEGYHKITEHWRSEVFYVHPETKLLCFYKRPKINWTKRYAVEQAKTLRILGNYHQLIKINGIWYEVKAQINPNFVESYWVKRIGPKDKLIISSKDKEYRSWFRDDSSIIITYYKQLNHKELKKHGVTNDVIVLNKCPKCGGFNCELHLNEL